MIRVALVCALVALPLTASADKLAKPTLISKRQLKTSKKLCEVTWPKAKKPSIATTNRCMQYWLFTYNYELPKDLSDEDAFTFDPMPVGGSRYTAAGFRAMSRHVTRVFGNNGWVALRAVEFFDASARTYVSSFDMAINLESELRLVLTGKVLSEGFLGADETGIEHARSSSLWLLRNAIYARHGRKFKHPDLNHFFYGKWKRGENTAGGLKDILPLRVNRKFKDSMLTKTDRANVTTIAKEEKARKKRK